MKMTKQNTNTDRLSLQGCSVFSSAEYHSVGLSDGKDSFALLLLKLEKGMPIDSVILADTGMDFPEAYRRKKQEAERTV